MAAELGFHFMAGRDPERARALPAHRGGARVRPQRPRRGHPPPARRARRRRGADRRLGADAHRGRAALVARPGARGDGRLVGGGGRGVAAARARPRRRGCRTTSRSSRSCSRSSTLYELRGEFGPRAGDGARVPAARAERRRTSTSSSRPSCSPATSSTRARSPARWSTPTAASRCSRRRRARRLLDVPGDARRQRRRLLPRLGRAGAVVPRPPRLARCARATHALELARDPSRAYSLATARAQMAVVHQCRREPEAALEWAEATIAGAQQLGYVYREAMGRVLRGWSLALLGDPEPGHARDHRRAGAVARHRRAHGRPALPRAARRGAPARRRRSRPAWPRSPRRWSSRGRERSLFYEPELLRLAARSTRWRRRGRGRGVRCAQRLRARARAGLGDARAADRDRPRAAAARPGRRGRGARGRRRRARAFTEGFGTRDLREAAALLEADQLTTPAPAGTAWWARAARSATGCGARAFTAGIEGGERAPRAPGARERSRLAPATPTAAEHPSAEGPAFHTLRATETGLRPLL